MIADKKEYLIKIFIKKCTLQSINKAHLDFYFKLCGNTYNISEEKKGELKKKFTLDEYIKRLIPIIDKYFSTEELKEIIKFYSSPSGRKMLDLTFLDEVGKMGTEMTIQLEQEFASYDK